MKQVRPEGGTMPLFAATLSVGERGQLASEIDLIAIAVEVTPNVHSSIFAKRKRDDIVGSFGCKKSRTPMSLHALRFIGLTTGHLTTRQDMPPAPLEVKALVVVAAAAATPATPVHSPSPTTIIQEVTLADVEDVVLATLVESVVVSSSTVASLLLSVSVVTTGAPTVLSPSLVALPVAILEAMALPSSSSHPCVSLDHLYTFSDVELLWGATYKSEQKTLIGFVSTFEKNLIRSVGVQNATDSVKMFLQRSLTILEENILQHQEAVQKISSLEAEVSKWRAIAQTLWRVELPKVANAIVAFTEVVRENHQLSSKVGGALTKLLHTRLDGDDLFRCCKNLQTEKMDMCGRVESMVAEKDRLAKRIAKLEAWLRESESRLKESELRAAKEIEASKELEEELILYKKVVEQHEKGFQKAVK